MATKKTAEAAPPKPPRTRSPNYPALDLGTVVSKLPAVFTAIKRHPAGVETVAKALGYKHTSSSGLLALGACRSFGLFEKVNGGTLKLSALGLDIATDYPPESAEWGTAVKKAALQPSIHRDLWKRYGAVLPADDEIRRVLVRELKFNDNAAGPLIGEYKATIAFAKLTDDDKIEVNGNGDSDGETHDEEDELTPPPPPPRTVRRPMQAGTKEDVFSLDEGSVVLQWPERLSKASALDLKDWLELIGRKIQRAVDAQPPADDADAVE